MDNIDRQIGLQTLGDDVSTDSIPQELDCWTVEDFEDLLPESVN